MPVSTPLKTSFEKLLTPPIAPPTKLPAEPPIESCVFYANLSIDPPTLLETSDFNDVTNFNPLDIAISFNTLANSLSLPFEIVRDKFDSLKIRMILSPSTLSLLLEVNSSRSKSMPSLFGIPRSSTEFSQSTTYNSSVSRISSNHLKLRN